MKRSEMIAYIVNNIEWLNDIAAEAVLNVIEEAGMLPPWNNNITAKEIINNGHDPYDNLNYLTWEKEEK